MELKLPQLSAKIKITVSRKFSFMYDIAPIPKRFSFEELIVFFCLFQKSKTSLF